MHPVVVVWTPRIMVWNKWVWTRLPQMVLEESPCSLLLLLPREEFNRGKGKWSKQDLLRWSKTSRRRNKWSVLWGGSVHRIWGPFKSPGDSIYNILFPFHPSVFKMYPFAPCPFRISLNYIVYIFRLFEVSCLVSWLPVYWISYCLKVKAFHCFKGKDLSWKQWQRFCYS